MPKTPSRSKPVAKPRATRAVSSSKKPIARTKATTPGKPAKRPLLTGVVKKASPKKSAVPARSAKPAKRTKPVKPVPAKSVKVAKPAPVSKVKKTTPAVPELIVRVVRALEDKKAEDLRVLDVSEKSSVTDYFVIATGNSEPHLRALRIAVEKELDGARATILGKESQPESGWCVVDAFDVIVHLFLAGQRASYSIESLWKNGVEVAV